MKLFVIGPSGAGKSSFCQYLREQGNYVHIDVDELLGRGKDPVEWPHFRDFIDSKLVNDYTVIDIGAGYQKYTELPAYIRSAKLPVVLVTAMPDEVIKRNPWGPDRDESEFLDTEYINMHQLYETATMQVDLSGLDKTRSRHAFDRALRALQ